ncbi:GNAT family N-acetyltransferase [Oceanobacillus manasiensis]|uniref:GNAT family N-acetyltransferase n=1 Tax=Oceanobacillus manasiensis TaxID=586413 RepID=UPI0005A61A2D|nr:GNAT family N-acetyltransferase [Oceanobacillus manasiensis]
MIIREIEAKDNQRMEHIIKRSLESFDLDIPGTAYYDPQLASLAQFYQQQTKANYWVAVNEQDVVVGGVGIGPYSQTADVCELQKLYIAPEAQGIGLSRKLMDVALTYAKEHYSYCYLETLDKLEVANSLYNKLGFELLDKALEGSDHDAMDAWYIKKLK